MFVFDHKGKKERKIESLSFPIGLKANQWKENQWSASNILFEKRATLKWFLARQKNVRGEDDT